MYVPAKNALTFKLQINPQYKSHKRRKSESAYEMPDVKFLVTTTFYQSSMFLLKKKREMSRCALICGLLFIQILKDFYFNCLP